VQLLSAEGLSHCYGSYSTDFRQFELYLNVTGVDVSLLLEAPVEYPNVFQMAVTGNSYLYHMRKVCR
jgi:hypothetical protein